MSLNDYTVIETEHLARLVRISKAYLINKPWTPDIEASILVACEAMFERHDYNISKLGRELIDCALGIDKLHEPP